MAGLGNPGSKYAGTRHNIGFLAVQKVAERSGTSLKKSGHQAIYATGRVAGEEVTLLLPQTFMNLSGASVGSACKSLGVEPGDLIVVHDDIDLPFGALKIKRGGGHGGHNGIRHIRQVLGTGDFVRVKIGVGRPAPGGDVAGYVLSPFSAKERQSLEDVLEDAAMAVEAVLEKGAERAMNEFNSREVRN
ncbi:MAG: aminoacyl-tRNA hydrolase [Desulfuromonadales bacterium]|nr:aminoacyl-tRNA hydrolase [Desulfuromonadales bacterium]MDW7757309.1 aminoacyl-tRNA hydrolase [Desulfuromonadales bacterium]